MNHIVSCRKPRIHDRLAGIAHSIRFADLPAGVVDFTKLLIIDAMGCMIAGLISPPAQATRRMVDRLGGRSQSVIAGTASRSSPALAVLANGTALRYLDFNDAYHGRDSAHPSGNIPVAMAIAEAESRSGEELIAAIVAGYEVHLRLCDCAGLPNLKSRGWHHTTNLQFAAAALASRLMTDDPAVTAHAMAIVATHTNSLAQLQHGQIPTIKATADAWVAKSAVEAALLACEGMTGPRDIFEGRAGWTSTVAGEVDYDRLVAPIDGTFRILQARIKPFPVVGPAVAPVAAAIDLFRSGRITASAIEAIAVQLPEQVVNDPAVGAAKQFPRNRETADHSYHYCVVVGLVEGECGEGQFAEKKFNAPHIRELLAKTTLVADAEFTALRARYSAGGVRVTLRDGSVLEKRYLIPPGHPENPLERQQIFAKFDRLSASTFSPKRRAAIRSGVLELERFGRVADFTSLLTAEEP
jgi:2-methylcitrate dehydratase